MLNKQFRLNLRKELDFFSHCKKTHTPYFSFFYQTSDQFQATVVVPKKTCALATKRNAVKRRFRSALQENLPELQLLKIKLLLIVHEKGSRLTVSEISQQILENAKKFRI